MGRHVARRDVLGCCCGGIGRHVAGVRGMTPSLYGRDGSARGRARAFGEVGYGPAVGPGVWGTALSLPRRYGAACSRVGWARASKLGYSSVVLSVVAWRDDPPRASILIFERCECFFFQKVDRPEGDPSSNCFLFTHLSFSCFLQCLNHTRPHCLLCRTWAGWAWATPSPLSECPEGRRSDGLLLPAPHGGRGLLLRQSWVFGMARGCVGRRRCFSGRTGRHMTGWDRLVAFTVVEWIFAEWKVRSRRSGYVTQHVTIIWVIGWARDGSGRFPLP